MNKKKILIGGLSNLPGPLTTITDAIISSSLLQKNFSFVSHYSLREKGLGKRAKFNITNLIYFIKHYVDWVYLLCKHRPNVVHYPITSFWNFPKSLIFLITSKLFGCTTIGHLHGGAFVIFWNKLPKPFQIYGRRALNSLDGLIVLGKIWKNSMEHIGFTSKIFILPNPIDENFSGRHFYTPFQNKKVTLLFVGRIGEPKGVPILLRAMKKIGNNNNYVRLILVGPEEYSGDTQRMKAFASETLDDKCYKFTGPIYGEEKVNKFAESDIFVFPSNYENFPLVIIEAMAAARPIICTPVGALPEYLEDGVSCLFVQPSDSDNLAEKIKWMLDHPHKAIEMGKRARKIFEERLLQLKIMEKLNKIYFSVL